MQSNQRLALVFDVGNVLLEWDPRFLYRKLFAGDEEAMERFLAEIDFFAWNLHQDRGRSFAEGVAEACRQFPQYCELIRLYDERYEETLSGPIAGVVEILEALHNAGHPLFALSNWSAEKFHLVRPHYPFFDCFQTIIISGEVGLAKPDVRIFRLAQEKIKRQPGDCLLIDDSLKNCQAAASLGFQIINFQSPEQLRQALAQYGIVMPKASQA